MRRSPAFVLASLLAVTASAFAEGIPAPTPIRVPSPPPSPAPGSTPAVVPIESRPTTTFIAEPIRKLHNVGLGAGTLGVQLVVPTQLVAVAGQTIACVIWFYDAAGNPIRSALPGWGDSAGHLRVISRDLVPTTAWERADFLFRVPYAAFPRAAEGRHVVHARAVVIQRVGNGRMALARASTTFFVE